MLQFQLCFPEASFFLRGGCFSSYISKTWFQSCFFVQSFFCEQNYTNKLWSGKSRRKLHIGKLISNKRKYIWFTFDLIFSYACWKCSFIQLFVKELLMVQISCLDETKIQQHVLLHSLDQHFFYTCNILWENSNFQFDFNT